MLSPHKRNNPRRTLQQTASQGGGGRHDWLLATERFLTYLLAASIMVLMYCVWQDGWFASVVGFGGPRNPTPDEVMMAVAAPQEVHFGGCHDRAAAGPTKGRTGGYGETVPRPASVASYANVAARWSAVETKELADSGGAKWVSEAERGGATFLHHVAMSMTEEHVAQFNGSIPGVSLVDGRAAALKFVTIDAMRRAGDCSKIATSKLHEAAEAVLEASVESRLWACIVLRSALGLPVEDPALARVVGTEKLWHSPEYRILLREWTRHNLRHSGGMCTRGFGTKYARYLAAGVWGVTYSRCIADHGCDDLPRVILKLAGLPAETAWKDARTDKLYSLSSASLAAGFDLGVESYMNEAVRMLITNGVTPHLIMGYGSWVCDHFADVPEGKFPITGLKPNQCKGGGKKGVTALKASVGNKEKKTLCTNILDEVQQKTQSQNLPVMAQEEVLMGTKDAFTNMYDRLRHNPKVWHQAVAAVLFEITYTVAALQIYLPHFRHNDMSWYNIRTTVPSNVNVTNKDKFLNKEVVQSGTMRAPVNRAGFALTHTEYTIENGTTFRIPNYGYSVRIADWDFAHATGVPRLQNPKILDVRSKNCGATIPDDRVWSSSIKILSGTVLKREVEHKENSSARSEGKTCREWAQVGCDTFDFVEAQLSPHARLRVLEACPDACKSRGGTMQITIGTPPFSSLLNRKDDTVFRDKDGHGCDGWTGQCDTAHCTGYTLDQEAELFQKCPNACMLPELPPTRMVDGRRHFLVRVRGNEGIPDGVYRAAELPRSGGSAQWVLGLSVANRTGIDVAKLGTGTVRFLRRPWHSNITVSSKHSINGFQRHEYKVRISRDRFELENFQSRDLVYIIDNGAVHNGIFKIESVPSTKHLKDAQTVEMQLISIRMNGALPAKRSVPGGAMFRVATRCEADFFEYSTYGISPVDNNKFDVFFFFNQLQDYMGGDEWHDYFPAESRDLVFKLFEKVGPDLQGWYKPNVHDYRMSNNHARWWCDRKGDWVTESKPIAGFGTPQTIMGSEGFAPFIVDKDTPRSGVTIAKYSLTTQLPKEYCVGTGELPIKAT